MTTATPSEMPPVAAGGGGAAPPSPLRFVSGLELGERVGVREARPEPVPVAEGSGGVPVAEEDSEGRPEPDLVGVTEGAAPALSEAVGVGVGEEVGEGAGTEAEAPRVTVVVGVGVMLMLLVLLAVSETVTVLVALAARLLDTETVAVLVPVCEGVGVPVRVGVPVCEGVVEAVAVAVPGQGEAEGPPQGVQASEAPEPVSTAPRGQWHSFAKGGVPGRSKKFTGTPQTAPAAVHLQAAPLVEGSATEPAAQTLQLALFLAFENSPAAVLQGAQTRSATAVPAATTLKPSGQSV
jgi:hypothetical protein